MTMKKMTAISAVAALAVVFIFAVRTQILFESGELGSKVLGIAYLVYAFATLWGMAIVFPKLERDEDIKWCQERALLPFGVLFVMAGAVSCGSWIAAIACVLLTLIQTGLFYSSKLINE